MTATKLTPAMRGALRALHEHGGEGVVTKTGTVLAGGEELADGDGPSRQRYDSRTWLRLFVAGMIEPCGIGRLSLSVSGRVEAISR